MGRENGSGWPAGWVTTPTQAGGLTVSSDGLTAHVGPLRRTTRGELSTTVRIVSAAGDLVTGQRRVNLESNSGIASLYSGAVGVEPRSEYATRLKMFASTLADGLVQGFRQALPISQPNIEKEPPPFRWLLRPIWPDRGITAVVGSPASMKSLMAKAAALSISSGDEVLGKRARPNRHGRNVLYLDWEDEQETFTTRMRALTFGVDGMELRPYVHYQKMLTPLGDAITGLVEQISKYEFGGVVIDSMSAAIGGSLLDDERVNAFYDAAHRLGVPVLLLAHKSAANVRDRRSAFFGSTMSLARVRMAWNVEVDTTNPNRIRWDCFKASHGIRQHNLAWEVDWTNADVPNEGTRLVAVSVRAISPDEVDLSEPDKDADSMATTRRDKIVALVIERGDRGTTGPDVDEHMSYRAGAGTGTKRLREYANQSKIRAEKQGRTNTYYPLREIPI